MSESVVKAAGELSYKTVSAGVAIAELRAHPTAGSTITVKMMQGAIAPRHHHPGGEETYVLSGTLRIQNRRDAAGREQPDIVLSAGSYAYVPPGETHDGLAEKDTVFLVVAPGGLSRA